MSNYSVTITGIDDLLAKLDAAGDDTTLRKGLTAIGVSLSTNLKIYPPKPGHSTYDRTGTLRKRWTSQVSNDGAVLKVGNTTPYAKWVQGAEFQTWYHARTGWQTAEGLLDKKKPQIIQILRAFIQNALNGKG